MLGEPKPHLLGSLPVRRLSGRNPARRREDNPPGAWTAVSTAALYWRDGNRNLAQVVHLTEMELGPTDFDFVGHFRFLRKRGYAEFVQE